MRRPLLYLFLTFTSLTINAFAQIEFSSPLEAVQTALENSTEHKIMLQIGEEKLRNAKLSIVPFLPSINFQWSEYDQIVKNSNDIHSKSIVLQINQMLYDNGKSALKYLSTKASAQLDYFIALQNRREFSLSVLEQYYNLLLEEETLNLKEEIYSQTSEDYKIMLFKYDRGLISKSEKLEYDISVQRLKSELDDAYSQYLMNKSIFLQSLNLPQTTELKLNHNDQLLGHTPLNYDEEKLIEKILQNNLELLKLRDMIKYESKQKKINNRIYLPSLYFSGAIEFSGTAYPLTQPQFSARLTLKFEELPFITPSFSQSGDFKESRSTGLNSSLNTQITPYFNYFSNRRLSSLSLNELQEKLKQREKEITMEISQYINRCKTLSKNISLQEEEIKLKTEQLKIYEYELEQGIIKQSDFLNQHLALGEIKQKLLKTKITLISLYNKLHFLSGDNL